MPDSKTEQKDPKFLALGQRLQKTVYDWQEYLKKHSDESKWTSEEKETEKRLEKEADDAMQAIESYRAVQNADELRTQKLESYVKFLSEPVGMPQINDGRQRSSGPANDWESLRKHQKAAFLEVLRDGFRNTKDVAERYAKDHGLDFPIVETWDERQDKHSAEKYALVVRDATLGGAMVPPQQYADIVRDTGAIFGVSGLVRHVPTTGPYLPMARIRPSASDPNRYPSGFAGTFKAEVDVTVLSSATTQDQPRTGDIRIQVHKWKPNPIFMSAELVADAPAFESELDRVILETFGLDKCNQILNGTGQDAPIGLLTPTSGDLAVTAVNSGTAGAFEWDGLMDLFGALPGQYAASPSVAYVLRRASWFAHYKIQDNAGNYVLTANMPIMQLMGTKVVTDEFVPAIASAANAAVLGDWSRYVIADRQEMMIGRIQEVAWPDLYIQPVARYGGQCVLANAFRKQTLSA